MRYLKRLKNELQELTEKLTVKGPLPEYVSLKKVTRQGSLQVAIALIKKARALDFSIENWSAETSHEWATYMTNLKHWLGQAPEPPKVVGKSKAAAE